MSNLNRGPSIDASYQVHLAKRFQIRFFLEIGQSKNKNFLRQPWLLTDWDEIFIENLPPKFQFICEK